MKSLQKVLSPLSQRERAISTFSWAKLCLHEHISCNKCFEITCWESQWLTSGGLDLSELCLHQLRPTEVQEYGLRNTVQQVNSHFLLGGMPQANQGYCKQNCFYACDINANTLEKKKKKRKFLFYFSCLCYLILSEAFSWYLYVADKTNWIYVAGLITMSH